jgi:transposase
LQLLNSDHKNTYEFLVKTLVASVPPDNSTRDKLGSSRFAAAKRKGDKMALFTRKLTTEDLAELEDLMQQPDSSIPIQRLMIILLSAQGSQVQDISRKVDLHPINVRKWIHRYNQEGIAGLRSGKSPGRPVVFSSDQREEIVRIARIDPRQLGLNSSQWSLERLRHYLIRHKIVDQISVETIRQVLHGRGIKHYSSGGWSQLARGEQNRYQTAGAGPSQENQSLADR